MLLVLTSGWASTAAYRSGPPPKPGPFPDVPATHWAAPWIKAVGVHRDWLRDYGTTEFRPAAPLLRRHLARAVVLSFAPGATAPAKSAFRDVGSGDPLFRVAAVAAGRGWMPATPAGEFRPDARVTKS
ncbi:MAG: S-layer homology domain-containing protein, partial [Actinomycetota bacterium]